jgi:hypothetical protein
VISVAVPEGAGMPGAEHPTTTEAKTEKAIIKKVALFIVLDPLMYDRNRYVPRVTVLFAATMTQYTAARQFLTNSILLFNRLKPAGSRNEYRREGYGLLRRLTTYIHARVSDI